MPTFAGLSQVLAVQELSLNVGDFCRIKASAKPRQICRVAAKIALPHGDRKVFQLWTLAMDRPDALVGRLGSGWFNGAVNEMITLSTPVQR
jgi:hypothetical protein